MGKAVLLALIVFGGCAMRVAFAYSYEKGPVAKADYHDPAKGGAFECPGLYCGSDLNDTHFSSCGKCERGYRVGERMQPLSDSENHTNSLCQKCDQHPEKNDWFFLAFHVVTVLVLQWVAIDYVARRSRKISSQVLALHVCALLEVIGAAVITILVLDPVGEMALTSCRVDKVQDWYTFLQNPTPNYEETLHCTQEAVYPLYTMVFVFHAMCGILMLVARPALSAKLLPQRGRNAVYAALYFLPALSVVHAVLGGLVYASYQYIVVIASVISLAFHFAYQLDQSPKSLLVGCLKEPRRLIILLGHWALHAFGILAITQLKSTVRDLAMLALVPVPAIFYIATSKFTDFV